MKTLFWMVAFFLVILFVIHFSMQNKEEVTLRYSFHHYQWSTPPVPLFAVILFSIFFGVMIGGFGDLYKRFQLKKTLRRNQKTIERLEKEVQSLKGLGSNAPSFLEKEE